MQSTLEHASRERAGHSRIVLPERLGTAGIVVMLLDAVAALIVIAIAVRFFYDMSGAIIALLSVLIVALALGRYTKSFAKSSIDAFYATLAVTLVGGALGLAVALALERGSGAIVCTLLAWMVLAGVASTWATHVRHRGRSLVGQLTRVDRRRGRSVATSFAIRFFDIVFASLALVLFVPILALVALSVLIDSGRPILFRQVRVGRNGKSFSMLKFRTMRIDAGSAWVRPGDSRITPVGAFLRRTSLDELPQLLNVLRGEMSLVGPRPEMREYADRFARAERHYGQRHLVRPGITGWAQLHLPRNLEPSDMPIVLRHDLFYVQNCDLLLYLSCLIKTAIEVVAHRAV